MTNPVHPDCARNVAEYLRQITGLGWDAPEDRGDGWRIQGSERDEAVFVRLEAGRLRMRGAFPASTYMLINVGISIHTRDYLVTVDAGRNAASQILVRAWVAKRRPAYLAAMARVDGRVCAGLGLSDDKTQVIAPACSRSPAATRTPRAKGATSTSMSAPR